MKALIVVLFLFLSTVFQSTAVTWDDTQASNFDAELSGTETSVIFKADSTAGTYNMHAHLFYDSSTFFSMWSNGGQDEDSPGQRVLGSLSKDGATWGTPFELFPQMDNTQNYGVLGRAQLAIEFVKIGSVVYAVATALDWVDVNGTLTRQGVGDVARSIDKDGHLGSIFWINADAPAPKNGFPNYPNAQDTTYADISSKISASLNDPKHTRFYDPKNHVGEVVTEDEGTGIEITHAIRRSEDNALIRFFRDSKYSKQLYAQTSQDGGNTWGVSKKTDIPDSTTKSTIGHLPDGRVYLIGSQIPSMWNRDKLTLSISNDGFRFTPFRSIRTNPPEVRYLGKYKGKGYHYPDAIVLEGNIWVIYSNGKEDIEITKIPVDAIK